MPIVVLATFVISSYVLNINFAHAVPQNSSVSKITFTPSNDKSQKLYYQLYIGGINAVEAELDLQISDKQDRYRLFLDAKTRGFLGKLVPWSGSFETYGWTLKDGSDTPEQHESISIWREEEEIKTYSYGKDGTFKDYKLTEEGKDKTRELNEELVQGTTDAMTAAFAVMRAVGEKGTCEGSSEVFDGKRRFKLVFNHDADEELKKTSYNAYSGITARCVVEVVPMGGRWHKKPRGWLSIQEQGRAKGTLPTLWLAAMDDGKPAVPVKMRIKTDYGTLFMHMKKYESGDSIISAKNKK